MKNLFSFLALFSILSAQLSANVKVSFETDFGNFTATLFPDVAPITVDNFLNYADKGDYDNSIMHRLASGFVLQGGGFKITEPGSQFLVEEIPTDDPIVNEFSLSNLRGTLAMAKLGGDPDSATSQWFINLDDNSGNLDNQNGGFTVFGQVDDMTVVDNIISSSQVFDAGSPFDELPLINWNEGENIQKENLVAVRSVFLIPEFSHYALFLGIFVIGYRIKRKR